MEIIDPVPLELDATELAGSVRPQRLSEELLTLFERARPLIEPKAAYTTTHVIGFEKDMVQLENGHALTGMVLGDMLETSQEIIPYVVTTGPKLENEISQEKNLFHSFLMDRIANYALRKARAYLRSLAADRLGCAQEYVSSFSPGTGTGELFGIEQQKPLFRILDTGAATIGVHLTPSLLMVPKKSASGVFAATREEYDACTYCPRPKCEDRRRPFLGEYQRIKPV